MKVKPLHDRVLVKRVESEERTAGGIIIPDTAKEKPSQGIVVAVGLGRRDEKGERIALDVQEGDRVLFGKYAGTEVKVGGDEHLILREDDIQAIIIEN
jgi:chaperonin GroES